MQFRGLRKTMRVLHRLIAKYYAGYTEALLNMFYYYNYFLLQFIFLYCNNFHVVQIETHSPIELASEESTTTTELEIKPSKFLFTTRIPPLNGKNYWVLLYYHVKIIRKLAL